MHPLKKLLLWVFFIAVLLLLGGGTGSLSFSSNFLMLLAISFVCELVDSSLGMGYGTLLTPTLLLAGYAPLEIIPTLLFAELFSGFSAAYFHDQFENVDFSLDGIHLKQAILLIGGSVLGIVLGVKLALSLPSEWLFIIIGAIIFFSGLLVFVMAKRTLSYSPRRLLAVAVVAAFNKAVSGGGYGPLITSGQILSGIKGKSAVGITALTEGATCLLAVLFFELKGVSLKLDVFIPIVTGALLSVPFAALFVSLSKERHFKQVCGLVTMVLGFLTFVKAVTG